MTLENLGIQQLSEKFSDTQVCHATGIELDIIRSCHDFGIENIKDFDRSWLYEAMVDYLTANKDEIDPEDLAYFTHETLIDGMSDYAPIGCYFGSHQGDATIGYWRILNFDIGYEYVGCDTLPYIETGYNLFSEGCSLGDKLLQIEIFMDKHYYQEFTYTDFADTLSDYNYVDSQSPQRNQKFAQLLIDSFIEQIVPLIANSRMSWQLVDGVYGIYPMETMPMAEYIELLKTSSIIAKLVFIVENSKSRLLSHDVKSLDDVCINIIESEYVSFNKALEVAEKFDHAQIADYINSDVWVLNWVIENILWEDYRSQIDHILGRQDITNLWLQTVAYGEGKIDGIQPDEVYSLRESCAECKHLDYDDFENSECGCDSLVTNVWIVSEKRIYEALKSHGAMVYETDSMYVYLQSTFAGNHYDTLLRKAWLSFSAHWSLGALK